MKLPHNLLSKIKGQGQTKIFYLTLLLQTEQKKSYRAADELQNGTLKIFCDKKSNL